MSAQIVILHPGEREDLRAAFQQARRNSIFGIWEKCSSETNKEKDAYDDTADYILAINEQEEIFFGLRVITKTEKRPLPIEKYLIGQSIAIGSVEFSRALCVRHTSPLDALAVYQTLFRIYRTAPGAYASVRESYLEHFQKKLNILAKRLVGKAFQIDGESFVHVAF